MPISENVSQLPVVNLSKEEFTKSDNYFAYIKPKVEVEYHFTTSIAVAIFLFNFILPGSGTLLSYVFLKNHFLKNEMLYNALCQFITAPIIVGWIMAQIYSCIILGISSYKPMKSEDIECLEYMKNTKLPSKI